MVNTLKIWSSASGANPRHSALEAITPATNVPWPSSSSRVFSLVQFVLSRIRLKCGWVFDNPVSKMATRTPEPVTPLSQRISAWNFLRVCVYKKIFIKLFSKFSMKCYKNLLLLNNFFCIHIICSINKKTLDTYQA